MNREEAEKRAHRKVYLWLLGISLFVFFGDYLLPEYGRPGLMWAVLLVAVFLLISISNLVQQLNEWCHDLVAALEGVGILHASSADYRINLLVGAVPRRIEGWSHPANIIRPLVQPPVIASYQLGIGINAGQLLQQREFSTSETEIIRSDRFPATIEITWQCLAGNSQRMVVAIRNADGRLLDHKDQQAYGLAPEAGPHIRFARTVIHSTVLDPNDDARFEVEIGKRGVRLFMIDGRFGDDPWNDSQDWSRWPREEWILLEVPLEGDALRSFLEGQGVFYSEEGLPRKDYGSPYDRNAPFFWSMCVREELRPLIYVTVEQVSPFVSPFGSRGTFVLVSFDLGRFLPFYDGGGGRKSWVFLKNCDGIALRDEEDLLGRRRQVANLYLVFGEFGQVERYWKAEDIPSHWV